MGPGLWRFGLRAQGLDILGKASLGFGGWALELMLSGLQFMVYGSNSRA